MTRFVLATRNPHKTREFAKILGARFVVSDLTAAEDIPAVEETGATFAENAARKAESASLFIRGLVVSDDSGLEVDALAGAPGVRSARYAGEGASDEANVIKLLRELESQRQEGKGGGNRKARFQCVLAVAEAGRTVHVFRGTVGGTITESPRGEGGFGYDPVFVPEGFSQTFAELGDEVKNKISHRARAIAALCEHFAP